MHRGKRGLLKKLPFIPALLKAAMRQELNGDSFCSPEVVNVWVWDLKSTVWSKRPRG